LHSFRSSRYLASYLLLASVIVLFTGCGGGGSAATAPKAKLAASGLAVSLSTLAFGNVQDNNSYSLSNTLTNTGGAAATISAANLSGTGFSVSGLTLPMTLSPNESVTFTVTFSPTAAGAASGSLAIISAADAAALNIGLSGAGTAQGQLTLLPANLSFGNVAVGANGSLNGTLGASGSSVTISSAASSTSEFVLSGISLPITLSAGQTTSFAVTFAPATSGTALATLSFSSDSANSPTSQSLTGTGGATPQDNVTLNWEASVGSTVAGYNVYRGNASGGPYSRINSALESGTGYSDSTVSAGQIYYYVTTAVDGNAESGYSNEAQAVIPTP
jgi:Abnormal spindle-like microcephaly-assoc'd, ASPM-SPD-2-Hydin